MITGHPKTLGIIGCGTISGAYFKASRTFPMLEIMQALHESSEQGEHIMIESICGRPAPLPLGIGNGSLGDLEENL